MFRLIYHRRSQSLQRLHKLWHKLRFYIIFVAAIALVAIAITACKGQEGIVPPLEQHPQIQVFFNHNQAAKYTDPYRNIERLGDNLEKIIIDNIKEAKTSLDIAVQELRLPNIALAIADAQVRGVKVRLILENTYSRAWSELAEAEVANLAPRDRERYQEFFKFADINKDGQLSTEERDRRDAIRLIKLVNIPWIDDTADGSKGSGLMHHKFIVVDNRIVLFGSPNFTMSDIHGDFTRPDSRGNANNLVRIESPELATRFKQEFDIMWGDGVGGKPDSLFGTNKPLRKIDYFIIGGAQVRLKFSPASRDVAREQTSNGLIATAIAGSKRSIDMALFVISDRYISSILAEKSDQNIQIRALIDSQFAYRDYSATLDMWGIQSAKDCKLGTNNAWKQPLKTVGVPNLITGDLLHHKFAILDRSLVITGSHNWTMAGNHTNDEVLVVIQNEKVAAHYQREYDRLYQDANLGPNAKLSQASAKGCNGKVNKSAEKEMEVKESTLDLE